MGSSIDNLVFGEGTERDQRLRIRRFMMSLSSYAMWYLIGVICYRFGLLDIELPGLIAAGFLIMASQFVFYLLIRTDLNLRFDDPSMTLAQILLALLWALFLIAITREIRGVMLTVYMVTLLFGIFALGKRSFMIAAIVGFLGYAGLTIAEWLLYPGLFSEGFYIASLVVLGGVLLWTTLFGVHVSNLRHRLSARNQELEEALERIRVLAEHDDLTGLYNRRFIMESLRREIARQGRQQTTFSVILMDLDDFKQVNDRFGHSAGDKLLQEFSKVIEQELRQMDIVRKTDDEGAFGRYGGEEFIAILPDANLQGAHEAAERLRVQQEQRMQQQRTVPHVTLSAGVAEHVPGESIESLLRRADQALYAAKRQGRNRVCDASV